MEYDKQKFYEFKNSSAFPIIHNGIVAAEKFETCKENK